MFFPSPYYTMFIAFSRPASLLPNLLTSPTSTLSSCTRNRRRIGIGTVPLRMAVHYLRPATLTWVLPVLPSVRQLFSSSSPDLIVLASCALFVSGLGLYSLLPLVLPVVSAIVHNANARCAPHAALLLGTIEHGNFLEGDRPSLPVAAPPSLHGVPAAVLVLANDPACSQVAAIHQVYVPTQDRFLVSQSRIRTHRFLKLVQYAYQHV